MCWNGTSGLAYFLIYHIYHFIGLCDRKLCNLYISYIWLKRSILIKIWISSWLHILIISKIFVATILGYSDTDQAIKKNVSKNHKMIHLLYPKCCPVFWTGQQNTSIIGVDVLPPQQNDTRGKYYTFIDDAGFYELVFSSKLEAAKKFRDWVCTTVLPSIRKYGQYKLFDSPWNKMIVIGNETPLQSSGPHKEILSRFHISGRSGWKSRYWG